MSASSSTDPRVLIVDDEPDIRWALSMNLRAEGLESQDAGDGPTALRLLRSESPDVMLLDLRMAGMDGMEVLREAKKLDRALSIIVLTAYGSIPLAVEAVKGGAYDFLTKPFKNDEVLLTIRRALRERDLKRDSEERYRELADTLPEMIYEADADLRLTYANRTALTTFGYTEEDLAASIDISRLFAKGEVEKVQDLLKRRVKGDPHVPVVYTAKRKDGSLFPCEVSFAPIRAADGSQVGFRGGMRDVTGEMSLQEQLSRTRTMEAIGQLAGGIAHEFNNLLTAIMGYGGLIRDAIAENDSMRKDVEEILNAGRRATALTHQLLAFSRRQMIKPRILDLNDVVYDVEKMLSRLIGEDAELVIAPAEELCCIKADPGQIEQILVSIAVNAHDAMPSGGKLTIETANVTLDAQFCSTHAEITPGQYVMLTVSDTGCGMDEQVRAHIFEPFFSTKEVGKGTGLGLAMVYGIVKQSSGQIYCHSELGSGTTFKVYFPRVEGPAEPVSEEKAGAALPGGTETILLVEDEDGVRGLTLRELKHLGYTVLEARNGDEALLMCQRHDGPIHLLLTDVVMPQMSGRELTERLTGPRPEARVLYMSGYVDETIHRPGAWDEGTPFIQKPYTHEELAHAVREALDQGTWDSMVRGVCSSKALQPARNHQAKKT